MHMIPSHKFRASSLPSPIISPLSFIFILWHVEPGLVAFLACQLFRPSLGIIVLVKLAEVTVLGFHLNIYDAPDSRRGSLVFGHSFAMRRQVEPTWCPAQ